MAENSVNGSAPPEQEPTLSQQQEPDTSPSPEDPGYLVVTGEAAAEDGSVAEIIGGLPAAEGSAWDIGAPLEDRGAGPADKRDSQPGRDLPGERAE